jgi:hypothetical protein
MPTLVLAMSTWGSRPEELVTVAVAASAFSNAVRSR